MRMSVFVLRTDLWKTHSLLEILALWPVTFSLKQSSYSFSVVVVVTEGSLLQCCFCYILKIKLRFIDFVAVKCGYEVLILRLEKVKYRWRRKNYSVTLIMFIGSWQQLIAFTFLITNTRYNLRVYVRAATSDYFYYRLICWLFSQFYWFIKCQKIVMKWPFQFPRSLVEVFKCLV